MLSLTDIYKAAGRPPNKDPVQWLRHADTKDFVAFHRHGILSTLSVSQSGFPFGSIVWITGDILSVM